MVYLDHAATTPMHAAAVEAMTSVFVTVGNASSLHTSGRAARRRIEESRELIADKLGARPSEVIFTAGGTESDNLAVKGIYWARRDADPGRRRIVTTEVEHHAVLDSVDWLVEHEGAQVTWLPTAADGSVSAAALREALQSYDDVALVSVMWANNEVGTVMPTADFAAVAAEFGVPMHSDAVQAVGQLPVEFAASGLSAMSVTAHKFGGPPGVGALLLRRDVAGVPLRTEAGRSATSVPAHRMSPERSGWLPRRGSRSTGLDANSARLRRMRDRLIEGVLGRDRRCHLNGARDPLRLPGNAHFTFRGCEGDALLMLLDANGIECSTGSACTAGVPQASHVLIAMGADAATARADRCVFRLGTAAVMPTSMRCCGCCPGRWSGPAGPRWPPRGLRGLGVKVLAAMSGGVDSSVAAARMVDAGHDVVGVHLALSSAPGTLRTGSRGCCSKEDAADARRVADVLGIPFYVWDFAERFQAAVIDDFVSSYARGETPNPCVRCNQRIKFSALSARAVALGFDTVATGHYARLSRGRLLRAVDRDKDQSYVLAVLTAEQLRHAAFPIGDTPKPQIRAEASRRGLAVADKPDSHDICFIPSGNTRAFLGERIGVRRGAVVGADGAVLASTMGCTDSPSASARAWASPDRDPTVDRAT